METARTQPAGVQGEQAREGSGRRAEGGARARSGRGGGGARARSHRSRQGGGRSLGTEWAGRRAGLGHGAGWVEGGAQARCPSPPHGPLPAWQRVTGCVALLPQDAAGAVRPKFYCKKVLFMSRAGHTTLNILARLSIIEKSWCGSRSAAVCDVLPGTLLETPRLL